MKPLSRALAIAGLVLAVTLFARENVGRIAQLVMAAVPGLVLAGGFHVVPMLVNAVAWQRLFVGPQRPRVHVLTWAVWIRESVNGVLPVARIGGELVAYRILRRHVASRAESAACLVADMALSVLSQAAFALLGLWMLFAAGGTSAVTTQLLVGVGAMLVLGGGFVLAQRSGALAALTATVDRLFAGRLESALHRSLRLDHALRSVYARPRAVAACLAWQLAAWILGAGEIWLALYFLGHPRPVADALVIEALIQAISSAAFIVPGALGIQEGGFVLVGAAVGLDATTSLALAAARRLRDLVIFIPGLVAWQWAETRSPDARLASESEPR